MLVGLGFSCASAPERDRGLHEGSEGTGESQFKVSLAEFRFSKGLPGRKSNFRFIVGLRFFDKDGNFNTVHSILPGLDTHWECAKGNKEKPNYVRGSVEDGYVNFDMEAVGEWDSLIFMVKGIRLHSIQFKVFDVNREDAFEKLKGIITSLFAMGAKAVTGNIPPAFTPPMQGLTDDLRLAVMNEITREDDLLFRKSHSFEENRSVSGEYKIFSNETRHSYEVTFTVTRKEAFN